MKDGLCIQATVVNELTRAHRVEVCDQGLHAVAAKTGIHETARLRKPARRRNNKRNGNFSWASPRYVGMRKQLESATHALIRNGVAARAVARRRRPRLYSLMYEHSGARSVAYATARAPRYRQQRHLPRLRRRGGRRQVQARRAAARARARNVLARRQAGDCLACSN